MELHLAADILGALAPFQFKKLDAQFFDDVFRHAQTAVFHIGLDDDVAFALIPILKGLYPPCHFRGVHHPAIFNLGLGVHTADVFTANNDDATDGCADGHGFPMHPGNFRGPQGAGKAWEV